MNTKPVLLSGMWLLILFIVLRTLSQVLFKLVALGQGGTSYIALLLDPLFYLTGFLFLAQAVTWLAVLRRLPLSSAYSITSLTVVTLLISGAVFFGESITLGNVLGTLVIMAGVAVIAGGREP